jgi:hypothetical protein
MKFLRLFIILLGLNSILPSTVVAQDAKPTDESVLFDSISIPPLSVMIDSALVHNPTLAYFEQGIG